MVQYGLAFKSSDSLHLPEFRPGDFVKKLSDVSTTANQSPVALTVASRAVQELASIGSSHVGIDMPFSTPPHP